MKHKHRSFFTPNISNMGDNLVSKTKGDRVIWAIVIILTLISLLVVYSSTGSLAYKYQQEHRKLSVQTVCFYYPGCYHYLFCTPG